MKRTVLLIVLIVAVWHLPAYTKATIPFNFQRGLVEVDVVIDGHVEARLGIDTGADRLYLDDDFVAKNDLTVTGYSTQRAVVGVHGASRPRIVSLRSLAIGDQRLYNVDAQAIDLDALVSAEQESAGVEGLIGQDVLQRFYITVDYPEQTISIQTAQPDFIEEGKYEEIRFTRKRHAMLVDVTFKDEVSAPLVFDYCASFTSLDREFAQRLGIEKTSGALVTIGRMALSDRVAIDSGYVVVSDLSNLKKTLGGGEFEGLLGGSFLYPFKITVDYKRNKIYFHEQ